MRMCRTLAALFGLVSVPLVAATTYGAGGDSLAQNDVIARHFDYYDELDLKRYESLEAEFGASSRVFSSVNAVRFGQLEVRARLVVPRSDAKVPSGFLQPSYPASVRVMLDYALVSCRNDCKVEVLTEPDGTKGQYVASHDSPVHKSTYAARSPTRSMVVIKGKQAGLAIRQLNGSHRAHIVLTAAAQGVADFEFDTSVGSDAK
jgi:hypothetical protein